MLAQETLQALNNHARSLHVAAHDAPDNVFRATIINYRHKRTNQLLPLEVQVGKWPRTTTVRLGERTRTIQGEVGSCEFNELLDALWWGAVSPHYRETTCSLWSRDQTEVIRNCARIIRITPEGVHWPHQDW